MSAEFNPSYPGCFVSRDAIIGRDVSIGVGTVIHGGVDIADGVTIQEHCVIGAPARGVDDRLVIPRNSTIRSHTVIYRGSSFGPRLETGHHCLIRERTVAGENLRIGSYSDIEGHCTIGDFCRFHGYVHVGNGSTIGHFVWLYSLTIATNDPLPPSSLHAPVAVGDGAVVCVGVKLMPGTIIGKGAYLSAGANASGEIPPGAVVDPGGRFVSHVSHLFHLESGTRHPWMRHWAHAYPEHAQARIQDLYREIMETRSALAIRK